MKSDEKFDAFVKRYKDELPMLMKDPFFMYAFNQKNIVAMEENRGLIMEANADTPATDQKSEN